MRWCAAAGAVRACSRARIARGGTRAASPTSPAPAHHGRAPAVIRASDRRVGERTTGRYRLEAVEDEVVPVPDGELRGDTRRAVHSDHEQLGPEEG